MNRRRPRDAASPSQRCPASTVVFTGQTHEDIPKALEEIALDRDNKALVITGTGDTLSTKSMGRAS
jgi:hypothetical protein